MRIATRASALLGLAPMLIVVGRSAWADGGDSAGKPVVPSQMPPPWPGPSQGKVSSALRKIMLKKKAKDTVEVTIQFVSSGYLIDPAPAGLDAIDSSLGRTVPVRGYPAVGYSMRLSIAEIAKIEATPLIHHITPAYHIRPELHWSDARRGRARLVMKNPP